MWTTPWMYSQIHRKPHVLIHQLSNLSKAVQQGAGPMHFSIWGFPFRGVLLRAGNSPVTTKPQVKLQMDHRAQSTPQQHFVQSVVLNQQLLRVQIDVRTLYLQDRDRTFAPQLCLMVISLARSVIILEGEHTLQTPLGRAEVTKVPAAEMNHMNLIRFAT